MKTSYKIFLLAMTATCVIIFWLVPGINKSTATKYTRVYEDTDAKQPLDHYDTSKVKIVTAKKPATKAYKTESIKKDMSWKKVQPKMFSRATHFVEEIAVEEPPIEDSVVSVMVDSMTVAQDTLARR